MGQLRMMVQGKGDVLVAKWKKDDAESVGVSEDEFDKMMEGGGKYAYTTDGKGDNDAIKEFDADADTITVVPIGHGG